MILKKISLPNIFVMIDNFSPIKLTTLENLFQKKLAICALLSLPYLIIQSIGLYDLLVE